MVEAALHIAIWIAVRAAIGTLLVWGAMLLYRGMLGRRVTSIRRCPKCSTDLRARDEADATTTSNGGSPRTCSFCGYSARRESRFHPRRGLWWQPLVIAAPVLFAGFACIRVPGIAEHWYKRSTWESVGSGFVITTFSLVVAAYAFALGARSLIGDPARGRRRCARCWYPMDGHTGRTCPECGRTAKSDRAMLKTKRRKRALVAPAALGCLACCLWLTPRVRERGFATLVPTSVLTWGAEWLPGEWIGYPKQGQSRRTDSLLARVHSGRLSPAALAELLNTSLVRLADSPSARTVDLWSELAYYAAIRFQHPDGYRNGNDVPLEEALLGPGRAAIQQIVDSGTEEARHLLFSLIQMNPPFATVVEGGVSALAKHESEPLRTAALITYWNRPVDSVSIPLAAQIFLNGVHRPYRDEAAKYLAALSHDRMVPRLILQGALDGSDPTLRDIALMASLATPLRTTRAATAGLHSPDNDVAVQSLYLLTEAGPLSASARDAAAQLDFNSQLGPVLRIAEKVIANNDHATCAVIAHAIARGSGDSWKAAEVDRLVRHLTRHDVSELLNSPEPNVVSAAKALMAHRWGKPE